MTLPEHRWEVTAAFGDRSGLVLNNVDIRGPREDDPTPRDRGPLGLVLTRTRPAGSIYYVESSGLQVGGSDQVVLSGRSIVPDPDGGLDEALQRAQQVGLTARLPIAGSDRAATINAVLHRSEMVGLGGGSKGWDVYDDRLGEFRLRYDAAAHYGGRRVPKAKPPRSGG